MALTIRLTSTCRRPTTPEMGAFTGIIGLGLRIEDGCIVGRLSVEHQATVERFRVGHGVANSPSLVKRCRSRLALARLASSQPSSALARSQSVAWNGRGIDLDQRIAFLDELPFLERDPVDLAVDPVCEPAPY